MSVNTLLSIQCHPYRFSKLFHWIRTIIIIILKRHRNLFLYNRLNDIIGTHVYNKKSIDFPFFFHNIYIVMFYSIYLQVKYSYEGPGKINITVWFHQSNRHYYQVRYDQLFTKKMQLKTPKSCNINAYSKYPFLNLLFYSLSLSLSFCKNTHIYYYG